MPAVGPWPVFWGCTTRISRPWRPVIRSFAVAGLWLALGHIATAAAQAVTIVGIPLAIANIKMIPVTCFPFGKQVVEGPGIL